MTDLPSAPPALDRILALLEHPPSAPVVERGYLDLLGRRTFARSSLAQALMNNPVVPAVYERWWRPALGRLAKGAGGPSMTEEYEFAREGLAVGRGAIVLDVACGPGNVTREIAKAVGPTGLVVGIDASASMLDRAVADTHASGTGGARDAEAARDAEDAGDASVVEATSAGIVGYVRGDAVHLPFHNDGFDAVCCWAALHLFDEPFFALDQMTRVLRPGGRLAVMTSHRRDSGAYRIVDTALGAASGMRMFLHDSITSALAGRGMVDVQQRIAGVTQFVSARKPLRAAATMAPTAGG